MSIRKRKISNRINLEHNTENNSCFLRMEKGFIPLNATEVSKLQVVLNELFGKGKKYTGKVKFLTWVYLHPGQRDNLIKLISGKHPNVNAQTLADLAIYLLDNYIAKTEKDPYKDHYRVLTGWAYEQAYDKLTTGKLPLDFVKPEKDGSKPVQWWKPWHTFDGLRTLASYFNGLHGLRRSEYQDSFPQAIRDVVSEFVSKRTSTLSGSMFMEDDAMFNIFNTEQLKYRNKWKEK